MTTPIIKFNNNNRHSLDSSIKVVCYFLKEISESRCNIITEEIKASFAIYKTNQVLKNIIENKIGYVYE